MDKFHIHAEKIEKIKKQISDLKDEGYTRMKSNHTYRGTNPIKNFSKVDMSDLTDILKFDPVCGMIEVESNIKIETVIKYLLKKGHNLASCPDLKQLTVSGNAYFFYNMRV